MKKLLYCAAALATAFFAASCQQESLEPVGGPVTFTVTAPGGLDTRVIADGENVNEVHYAVYKTASGVANALDAAEDSPLAKGVVKMANKKATLELDLLQDQDYTILFWAQVSGTGYYDTSDLRQVKSVATTVAGNDEARAAFFQRHDFNTSTKQNYEVTLYRPFAQLNLGTTLASLEPVQEGQTQGYKIDVQKSEVVVSGLSSTFDLTTGKAVAGNETFTYQSADTPAKTTGEYLVVNGVNYHYVAMNYLFVPEEDKLVGVSYKITTDKGVVENSINNVPVKENHRTNIIGNLLTSKTEFEIIVDERFDQPDNESDYVWGGEATAVTPVQDENGVNVYNISTAAELAWVAQQVNSGAQTFKDEIVRVVSDIDLNNQPWTPIGLSTRVCFKGMFEGVALTKAGDTYPTIKNLLIENGNCSGLFKVLCDGGKARNFNMKNVRISGERQLGAVAGTVYSSIENVNVEDVEITAVPAFDGNVYDNGDKVGGIAGLDGQSATISGCTVKNATFKGYRDMGGIIGSTQNDYPTTLTGNTVENLKFIVTSFYTPYMDDAEAGHYAPVRGGRRSNAGDKIENNTGDDITLHKVLEEAAEGGIYDAQEKVYTVTSPAGLEKALEGAGAAGAGDHTIKIECDLDMTGIDWTPVNVDGYHGADIVTVEGNGATITGLEGALFAGGFAGGSGIVIKDLTIKGAYMIADNTQGYGAFVNCADSMEEITLINCHLINSTIITPNDGAAESRIGGLVGWTAGYNNPNDGPVDTYVTVKDCSVTGCTIKGFGSIGGIVGHSGGNAATFTTVENCIVQDNVFSSTDDGAWRVGVVVGTANVGQMKIKGITASNNTLTQTGQTMPSHSDLYGRFVPGTTGTLVIDGIDVALGYGKNEDGSYNVNSTNALSTVLSMADASVVNLLPAEYKMPSTTNASTITINGADGVVIDNTMGAYCEQTTLTFNNVNFKTGTGYANGNGSDYAALYSKNVTYNKCNFSGPMRLGRDGAKFIDCTFNDLGNDYVWTYGNAASFNGCTFNSAGKALLIYSDGGNGAPAVSVTGCTFNATTGAKAGAISNQNCAAIEIHNYGCGVTLTTSGNTVETAGEKFSGEWRIKTYENRNADSKIFVNGTEYTTPALDGKTMTIVGTVVTVQD